MKYELDNLELLESKCDLITGTKLCKMAPMTRIFQLKNTICSKWIEAIENEEEFYCVLKYSFLFRNPYE